MTPQQIVGIGVRLLAIWFAVKSISYLTAYPFSMAQYPGRISDATTLPVAIGVLYMVVAALLWFFPMAIAHRIIPRTKFENTLSLPALEAARVGCALLGLWFLFGSASGLVGVLFRGLLTSSNGSFFEKLTLDDRIDFFLLLFEVVLAIALIVRAASFASFVTREQLGGESREF